MAEAIETKQIECDELGDKIKLEVSPRYLMVTTDKKTYYFVKETGKYDGVSFDWKGD